MPQAVSPERTVYCKVPLLRISDGIIRNRATWLAQLPERGGKRKR